MTQIQRRNWAEKRARNATRILNHMLFFFLSDANDARSYHPILPSRNLLARASRISRCSKICAARDNEEKTHYATRIPRGFFLATA
jgi:hypothetical protein